VDGLILAGLGAVLILTGVGLVAKRPLHGLARWLRLGSAGAFKRAQPLATGLAGALLGVIVTLTSVGAGALGAVLLLALYPLRLTPQRLVGTDLMRAIPLALVAGAGHWLMGNVDWVLLGWMLLGSVPGVLLGAHLDDACARGRSAAHDRAPPPRFGSEDPDGVSAQSPRPAALARRRNRRADRRVGLPTGPDRGIATRARVPGRNPRRATPPRSAPNDVADALA